MNATERRAKKWLMRVKGYKDVIFQHSTSPDFICPDGKGFEVKPSRGYTIHLQSSQWKNLTAMDECYILIFNETPEPIEIIPVKELNPPQQWGRYKIDILPDSLANYKRHLEILARVKGRGLSGKAFWDEYKIIKRETSRSD